MTYDSSLDTLKHIRRVNSLLVNFVNTVLERAKSHDESKLHDLEKVGFDLATPKLKGLTYGSKEYIESMKEIQPAIDHHRTNNSHHPEYHSRGIDGMTLVDLIEMYFDWKAASERHENGSFLKSLEINKERFNISDQLYNIFLNTLEKFKLG